MLWSGMKRELHVQTWETEVASIGKYGRASDLFPTFSVQQDLGVVRITRQSVKDRKRGIWGLTHELSIDSNGQVCIVRGMCGVRNDFDKRCSGRQQFCFVLFVGDSGHIYTHRAVASKVWMSIGPEEALSRLRRLGIGGSDRDVLQQGDILFKPVTSGRRYPENSFLHETAGFGHHRFAAPVLYADGEYGRQYLLREEMLLRHAPADGVRHPDVRVPPGVYRVGTTSPGLSHPNRRD